MQQHFSNNLGSHAYGGDRRLQTAKFAPALLRDVALHIPAYRNTRLHMEIVGTKYKTRETCRQPDTLALNVFFVLTDRFLPGGMQSGIIGTRSHPSKSSR